MTCEYVNYDRCIYSKLEKLMLERYGCVAPFVVSTEVSIVFSVLL